MSNLRNPPLFLRPSVVRALIGDVRTIAKGVERLELAADKLVDRPRRSEDPRLAKANDDAPSLPLVSARVDAVATLELQHALEAPLTDFKNIELELLPVTQPVEGIATPGVCTADNPRGSEAQAPEGPKGAGTGACVLPLNACEADPDPEGDCGLPPVRTKEIPAPAPAAPEPVRSRNVEHGAPAPVDPDRIATIEAVMRRPTVKTVRAHRRAERQRAKERALKERRNTIAEIAERLAARRLEEAGR